VTLFVIGASRARRRGMVGAPFSPHSPPGWRLKPQLRSCRAEATN